MLKAVTYIYNFYLCIINLFVFVFNSYLITFANSRRFFSLIQLSIFSQLILTKACFVILRILSYCRLCALLKCINNGTNPICERNIRRAFFREEHLGRVFDFFLTENTHSLTHSLSLSLSLS